MPQFKFAGMNCASKLEDQALKLQIHIMSSEQLGSKYKHIYIYRKRRDYSDRKNSPTGHQVTVTQAILNCFSDCH